jgi:hypothetical protein
MIYAVIDHERVVNVVEADAAFAESQGWPLLTGSAGIGWGYVNNQFIPPPRNIEAEWARVRQLRDQKLSASDIYTLSDRWETLTPEQQSAWATYRQELRDIPQTYSDPADVIWPTEP